jgi:hypothetical protein
MTAFTDTAQQRFANARLTCTADLHGGSARQIFFTWRELRELPNVSRLFQSTETDPKAF